MITAPATSAFGADARGLRLDTLIKLRWMAIAGQIAAILIVRFGMGFDLPLPACLFAVALSAWLNLALRLRFPPTSRPSHRMAAAQLAFDILQLAGLLYLTGGLHNPFALLMLAPVMISATALQPYRTAGLGLLAIGASSVVAVFHRPLPWFAGETLELPLLYVAGIWASILLGLAFTGVYAWRVAEEGRLLAQALTATEFVLMREQHLSQLDGLAAAAAHELGTPLATITLIAKDLDRAGQGPEAFAEDVALLREQVARCREILGKLKALGTEEAPPIDRMAIGHLIEDVVAPLRSFGIAITVAKAGEPPEPMCRRNPGVIYGLENLVENAVDFARETVRIEASWSQGAVTIRIRDDGSGFAPDVLMWLGDPFLTSRSVDRRAKSSDSEGLGLGLFIAKTLLERSGATLGMANAQAPERGAVVTVTWSAGAFGRGLS